MSYHDPTFESNIAQYSVVFHSTTENPVALTATLAERPVLNIDESERDQIFQDLIDLIASSDKFTLPQYGANKIYRANQEITPTE